MAQRILVVEDEQDHRELLKLVFSVHGYDVDTAANAREAKALFAAHPPDLVIIDVMLPDTNGWTLCERVKHQFGHDSVPVLMLSASIQPRQALDGSCADGLLYKPFDDKELLGTVRHLLQDQVSKNMMTHDESVALHDSADSGYSEHGASRRRKDAERRTT